MEFKKFFENVDGKHCFWVNNGPVLKNIQELPDALRKMPDKAFEHHVNKVKNDFANWIDYVIGDKDLANIIRKITRKDAMIKAVERRINNLKKQIKA